MRPTVLLTGGFGNLGGRVASALHLTGNWNIRLASRTHLSPPAWAPDATVVNLDLLNPDQVDIACSGVTSIIHLAALNDRQAAVDPNLAEAISGAGTKLLTDAAAKHKVDRFIFMSTAHVYGSPLQGILTEESLTTNTHPYATSHLSGEREVAKRHQMGDVAGIILRCANGFGVPMDPAVNIWHVLVNDLCNQVASGSSLTLRSSGLQERNFIPIADICSAILHFLHIDKHLVGDGLFNLGGPKSMTVLEMAHVIAERSRSVLHIDPPINRPQQTEPEILMPLDYCIDKLISTGFSCANDINYEIDQLLNMCKNQGRIQ